MSAPFSRSVVTTCAFFDPAKMGVFVTIRARQRMKTHWVLRPGGKLGEIMRNRIWVTWNFYFRNLGMKFFTRIPLPFDSVFDPESAQICVKQTRTRTIQLHTNCSLLFKSPICSCYMDLGSSKSWFTILELWIPTLMCQERVYRFNANVI